MRWRTVLALAACYAVARRLDQRRTVRHDIIGPSCADRLPAWRAGCETAAVVVITWDRRPRYNIDVFRRILTVTNLMCLAGNHPPIPKGTLKRTRDKSRTHKKEARKGAE